METMEIRELSPAIGAEIHGIDLSKPLAADQFSAIRRAYHDYGVIFFRDQVITPEQHIDFAKTWNNASVISWIGWPHVLGRSRTSRRSRRPPFNTNWPTGFGAWLRAESGRCTCWPNRRG